MNKLPAGSPDAVSAVVGNPVTGLLDSGQLFDVQVNELAWSGAAIAARWRRRIQQAKAMKRMGVQDARDSGLGQPTLPSDLKGRQP
jgi:hypothetical protein